MSELTALTSLVSVALLVMWAFWLYPDYRTDAFRQKMFKLRDDLFDDAASGKISFDSPAYGMLRNAMNGFIRFGHRLNIWQVLLFKMLIGKDNGKIDHPFDREFINNTKHCTENEREIFLTYYGRMNLQILEHLIFSSLILMVLIIPLVFFYFVRNHVENFTSLLRNHLDKLNTIALTTGKA